jgi:lipopolysaccharide biosynthesis regulator YciM
MATELLFLLLPVAVISGWWIGKRSSLSIQEQNPSDLSSQYFKGLNYLLDEQPDKAIEVFIKMLEVESETVETHFALGSLFRRRGEVDRAIRIHQNLIARPTLNREQRIHGLYELGLDYMSAGILGRAESLFLELTENKATNAKALQQLVDIYQQEKDWDKAITTLQQYETATGKGQGAIIAQYCCELAEEAWQKGNLDKVKKLLRRALTADKNCVRASLLEGKFAVETGDFTNAIRIYRSVEQQDADFLPEVIEPLLECSRKQGKLDEIIAFLKHILSKRGSIKSMLSVAELIRLRHGEQEAADFVTDQLRRWPSIRGVNRLIELTLAKCKGEEREKLEILRDVTEKLLEEKVAYKCSQCGFTGKSMHWLCPGCKSWNSVKPIQGIEGE